MRTAVCLAVLGVVCLVALDVAATDPFYVYRDIDLLGNATDTPNCDTDGSANAALYPCKSTLSNLPAQSHFGATSTQVRLPQFWDYTPINFGAKAIVGKWSTSNCVFPQELPSRLSLRFRDPNTGSLVATSTVDFGAELSVVQDLSSTISDISLLTAGKLYSLEVTIEETESMVTCETWRLAGLYLEVPVILPFIFENGFEEGQAAFWSEIYGY